ncbi:MAG: SLC13 family permease [Bryobacterales bacterium]|nr:SLC13 family permease [Bryobacterales bacterium]MDE0628809.1 SLC13 family permease [Bryobacterales bacterium]
MPPEGVWALSITGLVIVVLATNRVPVEVGMLGGLVAQVFLGVVSPERALAGFAHPAVIAIGSLFVVAAALFGTGATSSFAGPLLGLPKTIRMAQFRLIVPVALLSSCVNNTPVVAMYLPIVREWSRRIRMSPSKLLMPLSFASLLGGQLTLIGSASNLIVMGLYLEYLDGLGLARPANYRQFWGPGMMGLPVAVVGLTYLVGFSARLLPVRRQVPPSQSDAREYTALMEVPSGSQAVGAKIERLGLHHLPGLFLYAIKRAGLVIPTPGPKTRLAAGDRLSFAGAVDSVVDLQKVRGLVPGNRGDGVAGQTSLGRELVEAVLPSGSALVGRPVADSDIRSTYKAGVVAVHRNGQALRGNVGDIELKAGDTLLLEAPSGFAERYRSSSDFCLVSSVPDFEHPNHEGRRRAIGICILLGLGIMFTSWPPMVLCFTAALLMVAAGCISSAKAFGAVKVRVIATIASALGIAAALEDSGAAKVVADTLLETAGSMGVGRRGMVLGLVLTASGLAQVINKNGAAALMFPVAMAAANYLGVHPEPFAFSLIVGCGLSFMSPVSYNTNLMVYGPGGYKFLDFPRVGLPMTLALALVCALVCPIVFNFDPMP